MSILIEGMEMPKAQFQKSSTLYHEEGTIFVYPDGKARAELLVDYNERKYYPIIPVHEPHGRLGDLDKLNEEVRLLIKENMFSHDDARDLLETIADAPTVIPASGEE